MEIADHAETGAEWRIKQLEEDITRLKKSIWYGNGKPGMTTRMEKVEEAVASVKYYFRAIMLRPDRITGPCLWDIITRRWFPAEGFGGMAI